MIKNTFPQYIRETFPTSAHPVFWLVIILLFVFACCSCSSSKQISQLVERTSADTFYLANLQYDSIYIDQRSEIDRTRDTISVTKTKTEYRYKLLSDTVKVVQHDSIPYQVTVTETRLVEKPLLIFDQICRITFFLTLAWILRKVLHLCHRT